MMQGDACYLGIRIENNAGSPVTPADIREVEITLGSYRRSWRQSELSYSDGLWFFPLNQEDTFRCWPGPVPAQVRVVWANGTVEGVPLYGISLSESISKEVLL